MDRQFYVYILTNQRYGTLYVGITNDLVRRVWEHKNDVVQGFTREHGLHRQSPGKNSSRSGIAIGK
jgi:putative endonuclease